MKIHLTAMENAKSMTEPIDWKAVYDRLLPRVYHYFWYKLGNRFTAEELTAITFEKAWANREKYRPERGEFDYWVYGIARKVAADHFRNRKIEVSLEERPDLPQSTPLEEEAQARLNTQRLAALLTGLAERERELISLKYGSELTNREIARLTGLSESNVGTILHRVVTRLRQLWEEAP